MQADALEESQRKQSDGFERLSQWRDCRLAKHVSRCVDQGR
jgi:hypothetical protein